MRRRSLACACSTASGTPLLDVTAVHVQHQVSAGLALGTFADKADFVATTGGLPWTPMRAIPMQENGGNMLRVVFPAGRGLLANDEGANWTRKL